MLNGHVMLNLIQHPLFTTGSRVKPGMTKGHKKARLLKNSNRAFIFSNTSVTAP